MFFYFILFSFTFCPHPLSPDRKTLNAVSLGWLVIFLRGQVSVTFLEEKSKEALKKCMYSTAHAYMLYCTCAKKRKRMGREDGWGPVDMIKQDQIEETGALSQPPPGGYTAARLSDSASWQQPSPPGQFDSTSHPPPHPPLPTRACGHLASATRALRETARPEREKAGKKA